jgi:hypothetical protein
MKKIIIGMLVGTCFTSCIKKQIEYPNKNCSTNCVPLKGRVLNNNFTNGVQVQLYITQKGSGIVSFDKNIGLITTDENGYFSTEVQEYYVNNFIYTLVQDGKLWATIYPEYKVSNDSLLINIK